MTKFVYVNSQNHSIEMHVSHHIKSLSRMCSKHSQFIIAHEPSTSSFHGCGASPWPDSDDVIDLIQRILASATFRRAAVLSSQLHMASPLLSLACLCRLCRRQTVFHSVAWSVHIARLPSPEWPHRVLSSWFMCEVSDCAIACLLQRVELIRICESELI